MSDEIDPKIDAALRRHVRRARQILREDRILAMHAATPETEDTDGEEEAADPAKPKAPKRQAPAAPEPKAHPWWGSATS